MRFYIDMVWSASAGKKRYRAEGTTLSNAVRPNDLWCADFKGEFQLADHRYCYPLTITDFYEPLLAVLRRLWAPPGRCTRLPCLRGLLRTLACLCRSAPTTECPSPVASAFFGLSKLSVWWLRLGIGIERIKPGNPQQNGRHERMHLTLEERSHQAAGEKSSPATGEVRPLHRVLQPRAATPGLERPMPRPVLSPLAPSLHRLGASSNTPCTIAPSPSRSAGASVSGGVKSI